MLGVIGAKKRGRNNSGDGGDFKTDVAAELGLEG